MSKLMSIETSHLTHPYDNGHVPKDDEPF